MPTAVTSRPTTAELLAQPADLRDEVVVLGRTADEWAEIEAEEHDELYADQFPFGLDGYAFTIQRALWYEDYAYKKGRRRDRGHRTKKFLELVDLENLSGKRVLDIGCGIGQYSVLCAKAGADVTGVELSSTGVAKAREMAAANGVADRCTFINQDFTKIDFEANSFDVVMMHEVLHHAIKYPGLKEKIMDVLGEGGRVVIADTVQGSWPVHFGRKIVKFCRHFGNPEVRTQEEDLGDVLFDLATYEEFARGFSHHEIHTMSFLYMVKQTFLQWHTDRFVVRAILRAAKLADDVLLTVFPFLRKSCGEAVLHLKR